MAAETAILYNEKRIIPAPQLSFSRNHRRSGDQSVIGTEHTVTLTGTLVGCKGWETYGKEPTFYTGSDYPSDATGATCSKFTNLVGMQEAMRKLFDFEETADGGDYNWFEVVGCDGLIRKWRARTLSVDFSQGQWTDVCEYTITLGLQTDDIGDYNLNIDNTENWSVQFDEENGGIYTLTHTLSCQSEEFANAENDISEGWRQAKAWIDERTIGNPTDPPSPHKPSSEYTGSAPSTIKNELIFQATGMNLTTAYNAYDYTIQKTIDEYAGTYSISETWVLSKDPVFRQWVIEMNEPRDTYASVSVRGEFRSFLDRTTTTEVDPTNGDAALTAFQTWSAVDDDGNSTPHTLAQTFYTANGRYGGDGGKTLGNTPTNKTVSTGYESRGDGSDAFGKQTRVVQFAYEFSTASAGAEVAYSNTMTTSYAPQCMSTVTIQGSITGHPPTVNDTETTRLEKAATAYALIDTSTIADALYASLGGTGQLAIKSSTYVENARDGTINFTDEYTDLYGGDYAYAELTVTEKYEQGNCEDTAYDVQGEITGLCGNMSAVEALFASTYTSDAAIFSSYGCLASSSISRNEQKSTLSFSYSYIDCEGGYEHVQDITTSTSDGDCCSEISITGTITPYCDPSTGESGAVDTAEDAWAIIEAGLLDQANLYCDNDPAVLRTTNVARNLTSGVIRYTYKYQCCTMVVTGALKESINITTEFPSQVLAIIPILGRTCGPIIQDKGTKTLEKASIAIDLLFPVDCDASYGKPSGLEDQIQGIISDAQICSTGTCHTVLNDREANGCAQPSCYIERDTESWNPRTGRYTRNVTYIRECC